MRGDWAKAATCRRPEFENTRFLWVGPFVEPRHLRDEREARAKRICEECPVVAECAAVEEEYRVWGGLGEEERGFLRPVRVFLPEGAVVRDWPDEYSVCGTTSGFAGHIDRGERVCGACIRWAFRPSVCGDVSGIAAHVRDGERLCGKCLAESGRGRDALAMGTSGSVGGRKYRREREGGMSLAV